MPYIQLVVKKVIEILKNIYIISIFFLLFFKGKININTLESLVKEFNADDPSATDQQKSDRWNQVSQEYNKLTNQTKSRTFLMKKWINSNKSKEKQKSTIKAKAKKINVSQYNFFLFFLLQNKFLC